MAYPFARLPFFSFLSYHTSCFSQEFFVKTLIIDTSHERSIVVLSDGAIPLKSIELPKGLSSSIHLFPAIESLKETFERVAVAVGPGSFTGIRVGVAAAKGIATGLGASLVGFCSLSGFAPKEPGSFAALIDARMGGAYVQLEGESPKLIALDQLKKNLDGCKWIVGPNLSRFSFPGQIECYPDPKRLALLACGEPSEDLDILYLREWGQTS